MTSKQSSTKSHIVSVFTEMMETTPLDKIKVVDLCKKAKISRETFYSHFNDRYDVVSWFCDQSLAKAYPIDGIGYDLFTSLCIMNRELIKNAVFHKNASKSNDYNAVQHKGIREIEKQIIQKVKEYMHKPLSAKIMFQCHHSAVIIGTSSREWILANFPITPEELAELQCSMIPEFIQKAYSHKLPQRNDN